MKTVGRLAASIFGAILIGILYPIAHLLIFGWTVSGLGTLLLWLLPGPIIGAALGALFPGVFGFLAEVVLGIFAGD